MSQRECAGFNCPPLSIPAEEPVSSSPVAVSRAGSVKLACAVSVSATPRECRIPADSASSARGVAHPAINTSWGLGVRPSENSALRTFSLAVGVAHPARFACRGNWSSLERSEPSGFVAVVAMPAVSFQSRADGVTHVASTAA